MTDRLLEAVPLEVQDAIRKQAPNGLAGADLSLYEPDPLVTKPLVEPIETWDERLALVQELPGPVAKLLTPIPALAASVSHRQFHDDLTVNQGGRGSCWAWAGAAALEAAYARTGVDVTLSPQYLFHMSKAHENHRAGPGIHSLVGFQGSSDIVHHLTHWSLPLAAHAPYIDQGPLQALANAIPNTGMALSGAGGGTREQADWFEYDLRHIPLWGRWFAQYGAQEYGQLSNFSNDDIKNVLAAGFDVVVDVFDKINNGGHVLVILGYNDFTQSFEIKNSQFSPGFATMLYSGDPQFDIRYGSAFYITKVKPVETQWPAMWVGRWESDHDGWRGLLVIRRFTDLFGGVQIPGPSSRISLGTWYGETGNVLDVVGHFVDGGRGLHCDIGGQPFELYLHTSDPYRAGGRTWWNNTPFGVVLSRGTATGAGSGFNRAESIGIWDMVHDGWRGTLRIGVDPSYVQASDSVVRPTWIDPGPVAHKIDTHIDFGGDNRDQYFQILVHTQEDALYGGVTGWGGRDWPVEGRMSRNLYTITDDGTLRWYRNNGRGRLAPEWDGPNVVGNGWAGFAHVFGGGDGVVYGIQPNGDLLWYYHDGRNQGGQQWKGPTQVGTGWNGFTWVLAGDGGVVYAVTQDARLLWYRHLGRRDGSPSWLGPYEVGTGWNGFTDISAGPDGCVYGIQPNGDLLWYRHYGHDQGYPIWHGPLRVGTGWNGYDRIWAVGNGYVYGRTAANGGDLMLWRHHGFLVGNTSWTNGVKVGNGWGGGMREVIAT